MKEYYNPINRYAVDRHNNALDMNFKYIEADMYELPSNWGKDGVIVDLSASGVEKVQILKAVCQQLISISDSNVYTTDGHNLEPINIDHL